MWHDVGSGAFVKIRLINTEGSCINVYYINSTLRVSSCVCLNVQICTLVCAACLLGGRQNNPVLLRLTEHECDGKVNSLYVLAVKAIFYAL